MEKRRHKYNQERKEAYKQKPFIKPPRISFWDNIFYWSWYSTKHGLPHRTFATVTVMQYVYVVLFTAVILNCLDSQTAWHLYILHKSKGILGYILVPFVILILVNGRIYKESRYERLKAEFDRMEDSEKKRRRTIFLDFLQASPCLPDMRHTGCSAVSTCSSCCLDINKNRLSNESNPHHEQDYHLSECRIAAVQLRQCKTLCSVSI